MPGLKNSEGMKRILLVFGLCLATGAAMAKGPQIVAHRGYWTAVGSYENTISALRNAAELGAWGSEFDVWIAADSVPVVYHDASTRCGDKIEQTPSAKICACILPNGERIPTLEDFLRAGAATEGIKLILEIKPHSTPQMDRYAAERIVAMVRGMGLQERIEYISFSREVCDRIVSIAPQAKIAYLEGDLTPAQAKERGYTGIDYEFKVLKRHPAWFAEARKLSLSVNSWTVNKTEDIRYLITHGADYITTNNPAEAMRLAAE